MRNVFPKLNLSLWDYIAILIFSVPAFFLLGEPAIYIWDEAVYANASWDIAHGGSLIVPEHAAYNTKPPLVLWMQALSLHLFSSPEFAVRFPSALSVTGILFLLAFALRRWNFHLWCRILVMIAFVGNEGFIRHHISRTGDLDAVMTFFVTGYALVILDVIQLRRWSNRHLIFLFIFLVAAFYSKSIAGWIMAAPLAVIWVLSPVRTIFFSKKFWLGTSLALLICLLYYVIRESGQEGFSKLAWHSEYARLYTNVMPWHEHGFGYYFKNFISLRTYFPWIFFLGSAIVYSLLFIKDKVIQQHLLRWIILALGYMVFISIPSIKLEWYDAPAYPFFALILGVSCWYLTKPLREMWMFIWFIPIAFIFYKKLQFTSKDLNPRHAFEYEGALLRNVHTDRSIKVFMPVETPEHRLQLDFYKEVRQHNDAIEIMVVDSADQLSLGDYVIARSENLKTIENQFNIEVIHALKDISYYVKLK